MEWGPKSKANIKTLHPDWKRLLRRVKTRMTERELDCSVDCGYRGPLEQAQAVKDGRSFAPFPRSKHNTMPSIAVDILPYPVNWKKTSDFYRIAAIVLHEAHALGIGVKWGGMFKRRSGKLFFDGPHFQLVEPE
jgi:peptidoglycan L-alanyl-D-glutamate endopeptidase CwlK